MFVQALGERVMQLQYSRAFGGKDLKPFGLSAEPTVLQMPLGNEHLGIILASDGLWDACSANDAATTMLGAVAKKQNAAQQLVRHGLRMRKEAGIGADNITVVACFFGRGGWTGAMHCQDPPLQLAAPAAK